MADRQSEGNSGPRTEDLSRQGFSRYQAVAAQGRPVHRWDEFALRHPPMSRQNRAKQFQPYDALKGYRDAVRKKEEILTEQRALSEEEQARINEAISLLVEHLKTHRFAERTPPRVRVRYLEEVPVTDEDILLGVDPKLVRGFHREASGAVTGMDLSAQCLRMEGRIIPFCRLEGIDLEWTVP